MTVSNCDSQHDWSPTFDALHRQAELHGSHFRRLISSFIKYRLWLTDAKPVLLYLDSPLSNALCLCIKLRFQPAGKCPLSKLFVASFSKNASSSATGNQRVLEYSNAGKLNVSCSASLRILIEYYRLLEISCSAPIAELHLNLSKWENWKRPFI